MHRSPDEPRADVGDRLRFEMLLAELSARFVGVSCQSIDDEIVSALRQIVEALDLGVCREYVSTSLALRLEIH